MSLLGTVNPNDTICAQAEEIQTNALFIVAQILVLLLDVSGVLLCSYITVFIASSQLFHINFRILLINLSISIVMRSGLTLCRSAEFLFRVITYKHSCDLTSGEHFCFVQSVINKTPLEASGYCLLAIGLERLLASLVYSRYERIRMPLLGLFLALLPWIYPLGTMIGKLMAWSGSPNAKHATQLAYCSSLTVRVVKSTSLMHISMPLIILCAVVFVLIYFISKRKLMLSITSNMQSLSSRYQLRENVKSARLLAGISLAYTITSLTDMSIVLIMKRILQDKHAEHPFEWLAVTKEFASLSMPIFMNVYSTIVIFGHSYVRRHTFSWLCCQRYSRRTGAADSRIAPNATMKNHMQILGEMWDNPKWSPRK